MEKGSNVLIVFGHISHIRLLCLRQIDHLSRVSSWSVGCEATATLAICTWDQVNDRLSLHDRDADSFHLSICLLIIADDVHKCMKIRARETYSCCSVLAQSTVEPLPPTLGILCAGDFSCLGHHRSASRMQLVTLVDGCLVCSQPIPEASMLSNRSLQQRCRAAPGYHLLAYVCRRRSRRGPERQATPLALTYVQTGSLPKMRHHSQSFVVEVRAIAETKSSVAARSCPETNGARNR